MSDYIGLQPKQTDIPGEQRVSIGAVGGETTIVTLTAYTVGYLDVYLNGVKQRVGVDFTATTGTSFVMTTPLVALDAVEYIYRYASTPYDYYPKSQVDSIVANTAQAQTHTAFTTGGTATAYTLTPSPAITGYFARQSFFVTFALASGLNPTLAISGLATPPNLVKATSVGTYANIIGGDITSSWRSRVTLLSATQALVETLPSASVATSSTSVVKQFFPTF